MADLPTEDDLKQLPLRMIVALGARCALRVRPLYRRYSKDAPAIDRAIQAAERFVDGTRREPRDGPQPDAAIDAAAGVAARRAADSVRHIVLSYIAASLGGQDEAAQEALSAAAAAAYAAASHAASRTARTRAADSERAAQEASAHIVAAVAFDFGQLSRLSIKRGQSPFELGDPIDISEDGPLGPLWPDGAPSGWPPSSAPSRPSPQP